MCNIGCGFVVVKISRDGETLYLTLIGGFLISVVGAKFLLSLIHSVYAVWKNILYKRYIKLLWRHERGKIYSVEESKQIYSSEFEKYERKTRTFKTQILYEEEDHQIFSVDQNISDIEEEKEVLKDKKYKNKKRYKTINGNEHDYKILGILKLNHSYIDEEEDDSETNRFEFHKEQHFTKKNRFYLQQTNTNSDAHSARRKYRSDKDNTFNTVNTINPTQIRIKVDSTQDLNEPSSPSNNSNNPKLQGKL